MDTRPQACHSLGSRKQNLLHRGSGHSGAPRPLLALSGGGLWGQCSALPGRDREGVPCVLHSAAFCSSGRATPRRRGPGSCRWSVPGTQAPAGARQGWGRCTSPEKCQGHRWGEGHSRLVLPPLQTRHPTLCSGALGPPPNLSLWVFEFPVAAITNCHKFSGLKHHRITLL